MQQIEEKGEGRSCVMARMHPALLWLSSASRLLACSKMQGLGQGWGSVQGSILASVAESLLYLSNWLLCIWEQSRALRRLLGTHSPSQSPCVFRRKEEFSSLTNDTDHLQSKPGSVDSAASKRREVLKAINKLLGKAAKGSGGSGFTV